LGDQSPPVPMVVAPMNFSDLESRDRPNDFDF